MKRGTPLEPDTAWRREEACKLNPCVVVAQLLTSQLATVVLTMTDITHLDVLRPSRITRKEPEIHVVHNAFVAPPPVAFRLFPLVVEMEWCPY